MGKEKEDEEKETRGNMLVRGATSYLSGGEMSSRQYNEHDNGTVLVENKYGRSAGYKKREDGACIPGGRRPLIWIL